MQKASGILYLPGGVIDNFGTWANFIPLGLLTTPEH